tara:strand:+ start:2069 stop:2461 length:393 start_codon:yes stop_codon:yes gene_type:complete
MYLRSMIIPNDFKTFIIHGLKKTNVYGFQKNQYMGNSVLDGLEYIKKNYENSLLIPKRKNCHNCNNGVCLNCLMNINGNNCAACLTNMNKINVIYPISPMPFMMNTYDMIEEWKTVQFDFADYSNQQYYI